MATVGFSERFSATCYYADHLNGALSQAGHLTVVLDEFESPQGAKAMICHFDEFGGPRRSVRGPMATAIEQGIPTVLVDEASKQLTIIENDVGTAVKYEAFPGPLIDAVLLMCGGERVLLPQPQLAELAENTRSYEEILKKLALDWNTIYRLTPRQFEELIAELLSRDGFDVTLLKATRDGGIDILARKPERFGSVLYAYECKLYRPDRPVRVSIIRELATAVREANATLGVLCATSYFTAEALQLAQRQLIYPQDALMLKHWIKDSLELQV